MKATKSGTFKPVLLPKPQTTIARCYYVIDIGTIPNIFNGQNQGMVHKIIVGWELPQLKAVFNEEKGAEPFVVSEEFTLSTKENSNFAKLISSWRNKPFTPAEINEGFDPSIMVGKTALMQIAHKRKAKFRGQEITEVNNENTVLVLQTIMKRPESMDAPKAINKPFIWDWEAIAEGKIKFNAEEFEKIPKFIQDKIKASEEYQKYGPGTDGGSPAENHNDEADSSDGPVTEGDGW